jgi:hypothetical protein
MNHQIEFQKRRLINEIALIDKRLTTAIWAKCDNYTINGLNKEKSQKQALLNKFNAPTTTTT